MLNDPLVRALRNHQLLTPADLQEALRYREAQIADLEEELVALRVLLEYYDEALAIRRERDPLGGLP